VENFRANVLKFSNCNKKLGEAKNWAITVFIREGGHSLFTLLTIFQSASKVSINCNSREWIVFLRTDKKRGIQSDSFWLGVTWRTVKRRERSPTTSEAPLARVQYKFIWWFCIIALICLPPIFIFIGCIHIYVLSYECSWKLCLGQGQTPDQPWILRKKTDFGSNDDLHMRSRTKRMIKGLKAPFWLYVETPLNKIAYVIYLGSRSVRLN